MATCKKFSELPYYEQLLFWARLCHAGTSDDELYDRGVKIIEDANERGNLDKVKFFPPPITKYSEDPIEIPIVETTGRKN
jgi:hypothetical protein